MGRDVRAVRPKRELPSEDGRPTLYETPPAATRALWQRESEHMPRRIWEPCCGRGAIVAVLRGYGCTVFGSDLVDHGGDADLIGLDFLKAGAVPHWAGGKAEAIVTNPPYDKFASNFVRHAIGFVPYVAMLLRLQFLEGVSRDDICSPEWLSRVWVFRNRVPRMHRAGWKGKKSTNTTAYAWFVWDQWHVGTTQLGWVTCQRD